MKRNLLMTLFILFFSMACSQQKSIYIFSGSVVEPALDKINPLFTKETGFYVNAFYSGSGVALSQVEISKRGDIYISASKKYMDKAVAENIVLDSSIKILVKIQPAIIVKRGDPKNITGITDFLKKRISFAIGNPGAVVIGDEADKILSRTSQKKLYLEKVKTYGASASQLFSFLITGEVDAIIGWKIMKSWAPQKVDVVKFSAPLTKGLKSSVSAGVIRYSKNTKIAEDYLNFLTSKQATDYFAQFGYSLK